MPMRWFVVAAVMGMLSLTAAQGHAQTADSARRFVENLSSQAITVMTGPGMTPAERLEKFRVLFISAVDMPTVGKFVLGRYWRSATPAQRQDFMAVFEDVLMHTWANRFANTSGGVKLQILDARPDAEQGARVDSVIVRERQEPISVVWRLRPAEGGWRVADLIVEGASMDSTYRDDYASVIAQNGGSIDALIQALRRKVRQMAAAAR
jgi:phospholipid transport system substrate-binding protein